jgi:polysaccharide biosynthesis protein PslH
MDQGGKIRTGNILLGLKGGAFHITLASPAPRDLVPFGRDIAAVSDRFASWPEQPASRVSRLGALGSRFPVAVATDRSFAGRSVVGNALAGKPGVVVVDFPHTDVLMPAHIESPSLLFSHNVEAEIFERQVERSGFPRKLVWAQQSRKMQRFEQRALARYDTVIAVSRRDADALGRRYHLPTVEVIDAAVDCDFFTMSPPELAGDPGPDGGSLVFVATMSSAANVDGIHFLLDHVFPLLLRARPRIRAVIVGRGSPASLAGKIKARGLDVTLTGLVDDIRPRVAAAHVYVIPLFVGSGTRIKAFEAMAMGRPVVSTTIGVEGLDVADGENVLCADDGPAFARCVLALLDDAALRSRIEAAARQLVEGRFSWSAVARQFEAICLRTLQRRG